jgi:hypothetical protein
MSAIETTPQSLRISQLRRRRGRPTPLRNAPISMGRLNKRHAARRDAMTCGIDSPPGSLAIPRLRIADRKDLAPGAGPNSKSLARALARTPRAKLCCPVAGREALGSSAIERRDRRNFVGQIVQIERKNLIGWETAHQCIGDDI